MFDKINKTKSRLPQFPWEKAKDYVLGKKYILSLVFCGNPLSQKLNKEFRNKNEPANVLSFSLSGDSGEIFINTSLAKYEGKKFNQSQADRLAYLYIHGLLHLFGLRHGKKMDNEETRLAKRLGVKTPTL